MRPIKFRGKRLSDGQWIYGSLVQFADGTAGIYTDIVAKDEYDLPILVRPVRIYPETIGQFTGKTDSNGREIYEGDIVRSYKDNTVCIFTDCGFRLQPTERRVHPFFLRGNLTVIGNIHDNPEVTEIK